MAEIKEEGADTDKRTVELHWMANLRFHPELYVTTKSKDEFQKYEATKAYIDLVEATASAATALHVALMTLVSVIYALLISAYDLPADKLRTILLTPALYLILRALIERLGLWKARSKLELALTVIKKNKS